MSRWSVRHVIAGAPTTPPPQLPPLRFVVIVPCGNRKHADTTLAGNMYLGSYHTACRAYAHSVQPDRRGVLILSARYGLLALRDIIEPYDLCMGDAGAVTPVILQAQAKQRDVHQLPALLLGGMPYVRIARQAFPHSYALTTAIAVPAGIGAQLAYMKHNAGRLPPAFQTLLPAEPPAPAPANHELAPETDTGPDDTAKPFTVDDRGQGDFGFWKEHIRCRVPRRWCRFSHLHQ